jgi:phosphonate transport system substrate-binding protein
VDRGEVVVGRDIWEMGALLTGRKADVYIDSPYPAAAVSRLVGTQFLARRWKKGVAEYRTVLFAREAAGLRSLDDLAGKVIALEEPYSTSGYFLPKVALVDRGLRPVLRSPGGDPVGARDVGYVLSYDDRNTVHWVVGGRVAAGAVDRPMYRKRSAASPERLIVLYESPAVPRHVVSVRPDLPPTLASRLKQVLLAMDSSEEGREVLRATEDTTKFDELPLDSMRLFLRAHALMDAELGRR